MDYKKYIKFMYFRIIILNKYEKDINIPFLIFIIVLILPGIWIRYDQINYYSIIMDYI